MGYYESWQEAMNRLAGYGDYRSPYEQQLSDAQNKVNNWNYDYASDPSYQAYEKLYTQKGKTAMMDTLGQVSARTGGLASTYAQSAANQSFNNYMQQLAAQIPALENQAYGRAYNNMQNWQNQDQMAYSRWKDQYAKLQDDANFWYNWYLQDLAAQGGGSGGGGRGSGGSSKTSPEEQILGTTNGMVSAKATHNASSGGTQSFAEALAKLNRLAKTTSRSAINSARKA